MSCNCLCDIYDSGIPMGSGSCCYYHPDSGIIVCEEWKTEEWCNKKEYSHFKIDTTCSAGCDSCFLSGTKITTENYGYVNIEECRIGDRLAAPDGANTVTQLVKSKLGDRSVVSLDGNAAFMTEDHPLVTTHGLKSFNASMSKMRHPSLDIVGEIKSGDHILTQSGSYVVKEFNKEWMPPDTDVFTLSLNGSRLFFANGFSAHNKQEPPSGTTTTTTAAPTTTTTAAPMPPGCLLQLESYDVYLLWNSTDSANMAVGGFSVTFAPNSIAAVVGPTFGSVPITIVGNPSTAVADFYENLTVTHSVVSYVETFPEGTVIEPCGPCSSELPFQTLGGLDYYNCGYIQTSITIEYGGAGLFQVFGSYSVVGGLDVRENYTLHAMGDFYLMIVPLVNYLP